MTITAKSVLASVSPDGQRIDTLLLRYPRFIHAEFMTHRQFSRNASSSRAIPVERLIEDIRRDPAIPIHWGKNRAGMQAWEEQNASIHLKEECGDEELHYRCHPKEAWLEAMDQAIRIAEAFAKAGYHKQIVNRILEPFAHINVVVTATEWENFFGLRIHDDAQPEILALAVAMKEAMEGARVQELVYGEWHLPFVSSEEIAEHSGLSDPTGILRTVSAARCARTSYRTHDGRVSTIEEDTALGERLTASRPFHASPFEQQATPDYYVDQSIEWSPPDLSRNFVGWIQNRAIMELRA